jgi:hypothetical protein
MVLATESANRASRNAIFAPENRKWGYGCRMRIVIEAIKTAEEERAAEQVRSKVFEQEWKCSVADPACGVTGAALHLLARVEPRGDPIATLSVVDTTGATDLHAKYGLHFEKGATSARYTQLAVLQGYRGMHVACALMLEAERQFISPHRFDYTWLLFAAASASSSLCGLLGFQAGAQIFKTEHGNMRALVRAENHHRMAEATGILSDGGAGLKHVPYPLPDPRQTA